MYTMTQGQTVDKSLALVAINNLQYKCQMLENDWLQIHLGTGKISFRSFISKIRKSKRGQKCAE